MSIDLKKMAQDMRSRTPLGSHLHAEDFEDFARAVAEAVISEAIRKASFLKTPLQNQRYLSPIELIDLKREICGKKEAGNDQG
jgi:hypothetical protein